MKAWQIFVSRNGLCGRQRKNAQVLSQGRWTWDRGNHAGRLHQTSDLMSTKTRCTRNKVNNTFQMVEHLQVSTSCLLFEVFFLHRWWTSTSMLDLLTKWLGRPKQTLSHNSLSLEALLASSPDSLFSVASRSSISSSRSTFIIISFHHKDFINQGSLIRYLQLMW